MWKILEDGRSISKWKDNYLFSDSLGEKQELDFFGHMTSKLEPREL